MQQHSLDRLCLRLWWWVPWWSTPPARLTCLQNQRVHPGGACALRLLRLWCFEIQSGSSRHRSRTSINAELSVFLHFDWLPPQLRERPCIESPESKLCFERAASLSAKLEGAASAGRREAHLQLRKQSSSPSSSGPSINYSSGCVKQSRPAAHLSAAASRRRRRRRRPSGPCKVRRKSRLAPGCSPS